MANKDPQDAAFIIVNNRAEGNSPLTIDALSRAIAAMELK